MLGRDRLHVLHVTDCLNAGVGELVKQIANRSYANKNSLLWDSHFDSPTTEFDNYENLYSIHHWHKGFFRRILHLRRVVKMNNPQIVHAHSSYAGFYVRLFIHGRIKAYSPHCFSFDRLDISSARRAIYYLAEQFLHLFTSHYVINWPIEAKQASRFRPKKNIHFLPSNATIFNCEKKSISSLIEKHPIFIAVGRIRPQKDPTLFAEIAKEFNQISTGIFIWIGEGDEALKEELIMAGVKKIPWVRSSEISKYYEQATATIITSKWESGPLTLFESLNSHTPVILRDTKSSRLYGIDVFSSVADLVNECLRISNIDFLEKLVETQRNQCKASMESILEQPYISSF